MVKWVVDKILHQIRKNETHYSVPLFSDKANIHILREHLTDVCQTKTNIKIWKKLKYSGPVYKFMFRKLKADKKALRITHQQKEK